MNLDGSPRLHERRFREAKGAILAMAIARKNGNTSHLLCPLAVKPVQLHNRLLGRCPAMQSLRRLQLNAERPCAILENELLDFPARRAGDDIEDLDALGPVLLSDFAFGHVHLNRRETDRCAHT